MAELLKFGAGGIQAFNAEQAVAAEQQMDAMSLAVKQAKEMREAEQQRIESETGRKLAAMIRGQPTGEIPVAGEGPNTPNSMAGAYRESGILALEGGLGLTAATKLFNLAHNIEKEERLADAAVRDAESDAWEQTDREVGAIASALTGVTSDEEISGRLDILAAYLPPEKLARMREVITTVPQAMAFVRQARSASEMAQTEAMQNNRDFTQRIQLDAAERDKERLRLQNAQAAQAERDRILAERVAGEARAEPSPADRAMAQNAVATVALGGKAPTEKSPYYADFLTAGDNIAARARARTSGPNAERGLYFQQAVLQEATKAMKNGELVFEDPWIGPSRLKYDPSKGPNPADGPAGGPPPGVNPFPTDPDDAIVGEPYYWMENGKVVVGEWDGDGFIVED